VAEKKKQAELEAENRLRGRVKLAESLGMVAEAVIRWGALDPGRTSSTLTTRGTTRPEDK
jgi:hypothetical protein